LGGGWRVCFAGGRQQVLALPRSFFFSLQATADISYTSAAFYGGTDCTPLMAGWASDSRPSLRGTYPLGAINRVTLPVASGVRYTYTIATAQGTKTGTFRAPSLSTSDTTRLLITADGGHYSPWGALTPDGNVFPVMENGVSGTTVQSGSCLILNMVGVYDSSIYRTAHVGGYALGASSPQAGSKNVLQAMAADVAAGDYHGLVFNGDISYARGVASEWLDWLAQAGPVIRNVVSAYAPGNHETSEGLFDTAWTGKDGAFLVDDGGEKGVAYSKMLSMPEPTGAGRFWYTIRHGAAMFVQLSSDQSMQPGSAQWTWLNATLATINRSQTPWVAVSLHRPLYADTPESGNVDVANSLINAIEPLLFAYSVDAVFTGHLHGYTRSCAAAKGKCAPAGVLAPVHVMTGNGGFKAPLYAYQTTPAWEVARSYNYGYSRATITATTFQIESVDAVTAGAPLLDSFTLTKPAGWAPDAPAVRMAQYQALTSSLPVPVGFNDLTAYGTDYIVNLWSGGKISYDPPWWCWPACINAYACGYCLYTYLGISYDNYYNFLADRYVAPGSATYNLLNAPTDRYIWTPQQSWNLTQAALAISQDIESPNILLTWAKDIRKPSETQAYQYIRDVTSPGGRMYFGP
jgi:Calcineurin-like phosphoesterase/Iron/zinc purple acid phosphatase-like protein C